MNDDQRRLGDIVTAIGDAAVIVQRGRAVFDADPLIVRAAKSIPPTLRINIALDAYCR